MGSFQLDNLIWLLVKPGTAEHGTPEQQNSGTAKFRNTGTAKILNLVQILKSLAGGDLSFEYLFRRKSIVKRGDRCDAGHMEIESSQKVFVPKIGFTYIFHEVFLNSFKYCVFTYYMLDTCLWRATTSLGLNMF